MNEDAFIKNVGGTTARSASAAPATPDVEEVMRRHREEIGKSNTANISVKEAFRTRGNEAKKVIVSELRQMIDKRVWVPVMGGKLSAMERASTIRSSMFLKQKNNPDGSFLKLKARLVAEGISKTRAYTSTYPPQSCPPVPYSLCLTVAAHQKRRVVTLEG